MPNSLELIAAQSAIISCTTDKQLIKRYIRGTPAVADPRITLIGGGWVHVRKLPAHDSYMIAVCRGTEQQLICYAVLERDEFDALMSHTSNLSVADYEYPKALADAALKHAHAVEWSLSGAVERAGCSR